jgi:Glycosyltransferase family 87
MKARRATTFAWLGMGLLAALGVLSLNLGGPRSWRELGVPVIEPRWTDTRIITAGAECDERGVDPLVENACDLTGRALNYPRVWVTIANAVDRSVVALATIFSLIYIIGVTAAFRLLQLRVVAVIVFALAIFGPPAVLAFERGNNDLLIVGMVAVGACLAAHRRSAHFLAGAVVLALAAFLKLFPVIALPVLYLTAWSDEEPARRRRHLLVASVATAAVLAAFAVQASDIKDIFDHTSRPLVYNYGYGAVNEFVGSKGFAGLFGDGTWYYLVIVLLLCMIPVASFARRSQLQLRGVLPAARALARSELGALFVAGILIFAATMFLDNLPYKLTVLVLLLPLSVHLLQNGHAYSQAERKIAAALVVLIGGLWLLVGLQLSLIIKRGPYGWPIPALGLSVALAFVLCLAILGLSIVIAVQVGERLAPETEPEVPAAQ